MTLGWGVLGTGAHVTKWMLPALGRASDTRLAAVCSRDLGRAQALAGQFSVPRAYDTYEALLQDSTVDVVYVCTPNALHAEQVIQAARAGKHVLVEKPMALRVGDAEAMVEACGKADVRLGVGFHLRHHPAHRDARELIQGGRLGKAFLYAAHWVVASSRRTGWWEDAAMVGAYVLMARGVHLMDLVCFLSGREPASVSMASDGQRPERPLEEIAILTLRLGEDVFATLAVCREAAAQNSLVAYGTRGSLRAIGTIGPHPTGSIHVEMEGSTLETNYHAKDPYQAEIEAFNRAIAAGVAPEASGLDGLRVVRITEAALESARTGTTVRIA
jgi:1,5-anhydro-D-fructose reductase (1,5-anhydro-D-mannitol-forming)